MNSLSQPNLTELTLYAEIENGRKNDLIQYLENTPTIPSWLHKLSTYRFSGPIHNHIDPIIDILVSHHRGKSSISIKLQREAWSFEFYKKTRDLLTTLKSSPFIKQPFYITQISLGLSLPKIYTTDDICVRNGQKLFAHDNLNFKEVDLLHTSVLCSLVPGKNEGGRTFLNFDIRPTNAIKMILKLNNVLADIRKLSISTIKGINKIFPNKLVKRASKVGYRLACKKSPDKYLILKNISKNEKIFYFPESMRYQLQRALHKIGQRLEIEIN